MNNLYSQATGTAAAINAESAESASESSPEALNDQMRLSRLYRDHSGELSAYLRKRYGDGPPDPEDVVQQAFLKLSERGNLPKINNLRAFLWRTARNLLLTHKRNDSTRSKYDYEVELLFFAIRGNEFSPERVLEVRQQLFVINEALRKMPEKRRKAFIWHRVEGLNVAAVARRFGVTRAAAVKHIARAALDIDTALNRTLK